MNNKTGWSDGYYGGGKGQLLTGVESPAPRPVSAKSKSENMEEEFPSFRRQLQEFAENTCTNGVPNIPRARHILRKVFWLVVVLTFTGELSIHRNSIIYNFKYFVLPSCLNSPTASSQKNILNFNMIEK